jgi:prolyl oligopeptidase
MRWLLLVLTLVPPAATADPSSPAPDASRALREFFEAEWEWSLAEYPEFATYQGDGRYNDRLADFSAEAIERRKEHAREVRERLRAIDRSALRGEDVVSYDLFARDLDLEIAGHRFPVELAPISQQHGIHTNFAILSSVTPFRTEKDYRDYIARLRAFPRKVDQVIELMRRGIEKRWVPPVEPLREVPSMIQAHVVDAEKSVHFRPFQKFADAVPESARPALVSEGRRVISGEVVPAYRKLGEFVSRTYLPALRKDVGAWALPDGEAYYAYQVRTETTTDLTPKAIHEIGLAEVARIRKEMDKAIAASGYTGSFDDFVRFLRTDPRFYYTNAEDLLAGYRDICKRIDPQLPALFGRLPRLPYGVMPTPDFEAPTSTTAYYRQGSLKAGRPGYFVANTHKLEMRPKYEMEALSIHEAVPGHHLQIALAEELEDLPKFRRFGGYTAFSEGWGLYSESLGEEMGFYTDPYSKFGQLTYEMWRAVRLVVDTGIHAFRWDRKKAIDYFRANAAKTEHDIAVEVDRYIVWPGQALAYKIGERKIRELRERSTRELGAGFDVRRFHDAVLLSGVLPLDVLEKKIDRWIAEEKAR